MQVLSPETDNCPSLISGRESLTVENISRSNSTKECIRPGGGRTRNLLITSRTSISHFLTEFNSGLYSLKQRNFYFNTRHVRLRCSYFHQTNTLCIQCRDPDQTTQVSAIPTITTCAQSGEIPIRLHHYQHSVLSAHDNNKVMCAESTQLRTT